MQKIDLVNISIEVRAKILRSGNVMPILYSDYSHEIYNLHTEKKYRNTSIKKIVIPKGFSDRYYSKSIGVTRCLHLDDFPIVQIVQGKNGVLMTNTPYEVETCEKNIKKARGDVLELGLGLGYFTYFASKKKNVKSITIVELNKSVIKLTYPVVKNKKTNVINANARTFLKTTKKKFDMINIDFILGMQPYEHLEKIKKLASRCLKPNGISVFWQEDIYDSVKNMIAKGATESPLTYSEKPCIGCGKSPHQDYNGFCMDCADALGLSELFIKNREPRPLYKKKDGTIDNAREMREFAKANGFKWIKGKWRKNC